MAELKHHRPIMCNFFRQDAKGLPKWAEAAGFSPLRLGDELSDEDRFPKRAATILRNAAAPELASMQWGFERTVPGKRLGTTRKTIVTNVRNLESPFWRAVLASPAHRCLVPFSEFAEPGRPRKSLVPHPGASSVSLRWHLANDR